MRKRLWVWCTPALVAASGGAALGAEALGLLSLGAVYRFAGFSTGTVDGMSGFLAVHGVCREEFHPAARICTSTEYLHSPNPSYPAVAAAWIQIPAGLHNPGGGADCQTWKAFQPDYPGMTIGTDGAWSYQVCGVSRPVTCCVPAR